MFFGIIFYIILSRYPRSFLFLSFMLFIVNSNKNIEWDSSQMEGYVDSSNVAKPTDIDLGHQAIGQHLSENGVVCEKSLEIFLKNIPSQHNVKFAGSIRSPNSAYRPSSSIGISHGLS